VPQTSLLPIAGRPIDHGHPELDAATVDTLQLSAIFTAALRKPGLSRHIEELSVALIVKKAIEPI
jgi:hypothetical protein